MKHKFAVRQMWYKQMHEQKQVEPEVETVIEPEVETVVEPETKKPGRKKTDK